MGYLLAIVEIKKSKYRIIYLGFSISAVKTEAFEILGISCSGIGVTGDGETSGTIQRSQLGKGISHFGSSKRKHSTLTSRPKLSISSCSHFSLSGSYNPVTPVCPFLSLQLTHSWKTCIERELNQCVGTPPLLYSSLAHQHRVTF